MGPERNVLTATAVLDLAPSEADGLPQPLLLPTQSIVFRFVDGTRAGMGVVAIIEVHGQSALKPGTTVRASVVFPDAPRDEPILNRKFELWLGHRVGIAEIVDVAPVKRTDSESR